MTIPTREEALKALDKLSSDYDLAGGWSPDPMPLLATLRSYIESHTEEVVCPRSANGRPESFTVRECVAAGECGCGESVTPGSTVRASPVQPVKLEWQPIETAPYTDHMHQILLAWKHRSVSTGWWCVDEEFKSRPKGWLSPEGGWRADGDQCIPLPDGWPTHWMPIPTPPLSGDDK